MTTALQVAGLFAGIGGIERGLGRAGHHAELLCEIDPGAQAVLRARFPEVPVVSDITRLRSLPAVDLVAAGFPCQDLSQAGLTAGIDGDRSGLVDHVFRLIDIARPPSWLMLENVPFMLQLHGGRAMRHLTDRLEQLGYRWAYRVVDARAFGRPQRRLRVILLASRTEDPRPVLFGQDAGEPETGDPYQRACGFYWTEGVRGLGWAVDATPTLKGGSTIGIASPPGVWFPTSGDIVTPSIRDAERLQGFPANWTRPALDVPKVRPGHRWKLVGNAVSVPVAGWVGRRLLTSEHYVTSDAERDLDLQRGWPTAAWGESGIHREVRISTWPERRRYLHLADFLREPQPLSLRAAAGFLRRARTGKLRFVEGFLDDVHEHITRVGGDALAAVS
ncbi:MAG TPA: DNA (cytosine-5-)-methyltransferase [Mycobacteriales bacterium]|nr:DNA (cytosine-5-)-methyltransferase [Mycobacteriales bacterium]